MTAMDTRDTNAPSSVLSVRSFGTRRYRSTDRSRAAKPPGPRMDVAIRAYTHSDERGRSELVKCWSAGYPLSTLHCGREAGVCTHTLLAKKRMPAALNKSATRQRTKFQYADACPRRCRRLPYHPWGNHLLQEHALRLPGPPPCPCRSFSPPALRPHQPLGAARSYR